MKGDVRIEKIVVKRHANKEKKLEAKFKSKYSLITCIISILYFALIISTEMTYKKKLFDKSIKFQEDLREKFDKESSFYKFWNFISFFGTNLFCFGVFFIIFIFFPLNSSFLVLQSLNFADYLTNLFKIIYRNPRPYWKSNRLDIVCNSGYGNPSGHSVIGLSFYLVLWHVFTNFDFFRKNKKGQILRIIIFCFFSVLIVLIIISRFFLSSHSINQILYGTLLGFGIYFLEIHIISYHTYSSKQFIKHIVSQNVVLIYFIIYAFLLGLLLVIYFCFDDDKFLENFIFANIFNGERCDKKRKYQVLKTTGFTQALGITSIIGAHLGTILLIYVLKKFNYKIDNINEFNRTSIKKWFMRLPILILSVIFVILYIAVPKSSTLAIIVIFKFALAFFLTGFGIYFTGIFICIYCNFGNENIKKIE
jgi:membrane-associated phospholipid phosphatase